jgi:hypothetical protein
MKDLGDVRVEDHDDGVCAHLTREPVRTRRGVLKAILAREVRLLAASPATCAWLLHSLALSPGRAPCTDDADRALTFGKRHDEEASLPS